MTAVVTRYGAGAATAVLGRTMWLLVDTPADSVVASRLEEAVRTESGTDLVLDALLAIGFTRLPSLVMTSVDPEGLWVLTRGSGRLTIERAGGEQLVLDSEGLATWGEHRVSFDGLHAARLTLAEEPPEHSDVLTVPVGTLLPASYIEVRWALPQDRPQARGPEITAEWRSTTREEVGLMAPPTEADSQSPASGAESAAPVEISYEYLFGATTTRSVEGAAVRADTGDDGDLFTTPVALVPAGTPQPALSQRAAQVASPVEAGVALDEHTVQRPSRMAGTTSPTVLAVRCGAGHLNSSHATSCRVCDGLIPEQDSIEIARPPLGVLALSTGARILLDRNVVLGRSPAWEGDSCRPHLIKVTNSAGDVSRSHVAVEIDDWQVHVRDLSSTNGTYVTVPGQQSWRLPPGEPFVIQPGTRVSLAEDVFFNFDPE